MLYALMTGVSGLLAHQRMLDVTGNNLANVNTTAYKSQRVLFSDIYYQTLRSASNGQATNLGGVNPSQVGTGAVVSQIDRNFNQSSLELTGGAFDAAIEGDGFFVVNDGTNDLLTRAGTFGLDADQMLVDQATGGHVVRIGTTGESNGVNPGFQVSGDSAIRVPLGATVLGTETSSIEVTGNLSADAPGPTAEVQTTAAPLLTGAAPVSLATLLNALDTNLSAYQAGDMLQLSGVDHDGTVVNSTLNVDGTTTVGDLINAINGAFSGATAQLDSNGNLQLTSSSDAASQLQLDISDAGSNVGGTNFAQHPLITTTLGSDGEVVRTPVEFFDAIGRSHVLNVTFTKLATPQTWNVALDLDPADGSLTISNLGDIVFNDDGSFQQVGATGSRSVPLAILPTGQTNAQTVSLQLGGVDGFSGLTQTANESSTLGLADGFAAGTLYAATIQQDGTLMGLGTNGRQVALAQLAVAHVINNEGLEAVGENKFISTVNSGQVQMGIATTGGRGRVVSGYLESSNVDLAFEFTRLIVAQRGFSANARSITVADQMIEEVTNIIR